MLRYFFFRPTLYYEFMNRMQQEKIWKIIARSISGTLGNKEKKLLEDWLSQDPDNMALYKTLIENQFRPSLPEDADEIKTRIWLKIAAGTIDEKTPHNLIEKKFYRNWAIAASLLMLLSLGILFYYLMNKPEWITSVSSPGGDKVFSVQLPDNSEVWLESGSQIIYPRKFGLGKREVFLTGQAFFDIKPKRKQFVVHAGELNIKVHGTRFSVIAFPNEEKELVTLVSGSISLEMDKNPSMHLKPGEQGVIDRIKKTIFIHRVDPEPFEAWKDGILIFRSTRFDEIAVCLERVHHVRILFIDENLKKEVFTGRFQRTESVEKVLNVIRISTPFHYKIINRTIEIYR